MQSGEPREPHARPATELASPRPRSLPPPRTPVVTVHPGADRPLQQALRWPGLPATAGRVIAVTALAFGLQAHALQVVDASDGVAVEAIVSVKEPTRIRIDGAPITDVFGNIQASHCAPGVAPLPSLPASPGVPTSPSSSVPSPTLLNPAGEVVVECDRDKGEIYIRPVGSAGKPINLFVASASATYTLVLRHADTPADTILIRDRTPRALRPGAVGAAPSTASGPAPSHVRTMKALLVAMASDRVPPDIRVDEVSRPIRLWNEARFHLLRVYEGRGYVLSLIHI